MDTLTYAPQIAGYEKTVGLRQQLFSSPDFIPMGDPAKAAQAMIGVVENPKPPVHLVLGSEAVSMIQQANAARQAEMEEYMHVSTSTDHEDAQNVLESSLGRQLFGAKN